MDLLLFLLALASALLWLAYVGVARLPSAPQCPDCRAMTSECETRAFVTRAIPHSTPVTLRSCSRCEWKGYMQWRSASARARHGSGRS